MSYIAMGAVQTRIREVLTLAAGELRTIALDTYGGNLPEDFSAHATAVRALATPQVEALITNAVPSKSSPILLSNVSLYSFEVRVRVVRMLPIEGQILGVSRDAVKAAAATDVDVIRQALGFPGNLTATEAAVPTGIVSGLLTHQSSTTSVRSVVDDGVATIETLHLFTGTVRGAPAVS